VFFPYDIASGVIEVVTPGPDPLHLLSRPLMVAYADGTNSEDIADVTNSAGRIILPGSNTVIYTNCCAGLECDSVVANRKSGCQGEVVFGHRPPDRAKFGMNPQTTRIQVVTEFFDTADPALHSVLTNRATGLPDPVLKFGAMRMGHGLVR